MAQGSAHIQLQVTLQEQLIRAIVREEIVKALGALKREADRLDMPYETAELDSRALTNIAQAAEGAIQRLTCSHPKYYTWHDVPRCGRCGEPEEAPANPFEDKPLDPDCNHAFSAENGVSACQLCEGVKTDAKG